MKKTSSFSRAIRALGLLASAGMIAPVYAQSSVTLYGILDEGITYTNNQHGNGAWQASNQNVDGTRWGLRGLEDLGNGLSAVFTLENGFSLTNGAAASSSQLFNRLAFVGLSSSRYGSVTLGRQLDSVVDYLGSQALTGTGYGGVHTAHPFDNDNLDDSFRVNNAIKYTSPNWGGLTFGGLYGFSNTAGGFAENRAYSAGASYDFSGFHVAAAYLQLNNSGALPGFSSSGAVTGDATFNASRQQTFGATAAYSVDKGSAAFIFTETRLRQAGRINAYASGTSSGIAFTGGDARFDNLELNAHYFVTPAFTLSGGYTFTEGRFDGFHPKWHQINLLAAYAFSKRTDIYLQADWQRVSGLAGTGIGADIIGLPASSSNQQVAVSAGIRHFF